MLRRVGIDACEASAGADEWPASKSLRKADGFMDAMATDRITQRRSAQGTTVEIGRYAQA